jgi:WD40 repeat protein
MQASRLALWTTLFACLLCRLISPESPGAGRAAAAQKERTSQVVRPACVAFSNDGKLVLVGFTNIFPGADQTHSGRVIKIWDTATKKEVRTLVGHDGGVNRAAFFDNDKKIISSGGDGVFRAWDVESGSSIWTRPSDGRLVGVLRGGEHVLSHGKGKISCWKVEPQGLSLFAEYQAPSARSIILSPKGDYAFIEESKSSPDGKPIWATQLIRLPELKFVKRFETKSVNGSLVGLSAPTVFSRKEDLAIFGKFDGKQAFLVSLEISSGKEIRVLGKSAERSPQDAAVSSDGRTIVCRSRQGELFACDLESGQELWALHDKSLERSPLFAFSPDAKLALSATGYRSTGQGDLRLLLWDTASGKYLGSLSRPVFP